MITSASVVLHSRQVQYKNAESVEQALNELYQKADQLFAYHVGDEIKVNGIDFYVIADSPLKQDYVVALKKEPLTVAEVNQFGGVGTENNHVNRFTQSNVGTAKNQNGYGGMTFFSSETCGHYNGRAVSNGCTIDYNLSDIKYVIDNWSLSKFLNNELKTVDGYSSRLVTKEEYELIPTSNNWRYLFAWYWTMTPANSTTLLWLVMSTGELYNGYYTGIFSNGGGLVRPVINVYKSAIQK